MKRFGMALVGLMLGTTSAVAQLDLSFESSVDIRGLNLKDAGGAAIDTATGNLWLCDGCGPACPSGGSNRVWQLDALTGTALSSFDAAVIPGLDVGADALALRPGTDEVFLFSAYLEDEAGVASQAGVFQREFGGSLAASAAGFDDADQLWIFSDSGGGAGGDGLLHRLNPQTGASVESRALVGYSGRVLALDFDPVTGNLFCFADSGDDLLEVDVATGNVLSITELSSLGIDGLGIPTGFAFSPSGDRVFLFKGNDAEAEQYLVLERQTSGGWKDLGGGLAGSDGIPTLTGSGDLNVGNTVTIDLVGAREKRLAYLIIGFSRLDAPFNGGTLIPSPDFIQTVKIDDQGELHLTGTWPDGVPSGTPIIMQVWIKDNNGPKNYAASNAICAIVP